MDRYAFQNDIARPAASDYAWAVSRGRSSRECKSRMPTGRTAIERCGPYVEIDEAGIDIDARILAHSAVKRAARELGCAPPRVRWFTTVREVKIKKPWGQFCFDSPDSIWISPCVRVVAAR